MDDEMREKIAKLYAKDQYGALWEEWPAMNAEGFWVGKMQTGNMGRWRLLQQRV